MDSHTSTKTTQICDFFLFFLSSTQAVPWTHPAALQSCNSQSQSSSNPRGCFYYLFLNKRIDNRHLFKFFFIIEHFPSVCRYIWRRPPGPLLSLRSGPLMLTRLLEIRSSAFCACVPPSWTSSVWPMKTPSLERTTLSLYLCLSS